MDDARAPQATDQQTEALIAPEFGRDDPVARVDPGTAATADLIAERDHLTRRLREVEAKSETRITDLQHQLNAAFVRYDCVAARFPLLEARLTAALAVPGSERQGLLDLRKQLGQREAEASVAVARYGVLKQANRDAMGQLVEEQKFALAERVAHSERIDMAERARLALDRRCVEAERRAGMAEAGLASTADVAAASEASMRSAEHRLENQRAGSASERRQSATERVELLGELVQMRESTALAQEQFAAAVKAAGQFRAAAEQLARQNSATAEQVRKCTDHAVREANERRIGTEHQLSAIERARAGLAGERDRLTSALGIAEAALARVEERLRIAETERDAFKQAASAVTVAPT